MKLAILPALSFASLGVLVGLGGTTFNYAEGLSYLSTDPAACTNCHIMQPEYDAWQKASHHTAATCVDCHLPHELLGKYIAKAENGWNHSKAFTLQDFPEPIVITKKNADILHAKYEKWSDESLGSLGTQSTSEYQPRLPNLPQILREGNSSAGG